MKLQNLFLNLAKRLNALKTYTDTEISAVDARLDVVEELGTLVGAVVKQGKNQTITIPAKSTWRYMLVTAYATVNNLDVIYQNVIFSTQTFNTSIFFVGGYYYLSTDRGLCNVNLYMPDENGGTISLRNFLYSDSDYGSTAYLQVRFFI